MLNNASKFVLTGLFLLAQYAHAEDRSVWQGVYVLEQADRGKALFTQHCVACHTDEPGKVAGHGPAPQVFGADFEFRWIDASVLDVLDLVRQTMPEAAPNSLSLDEYGDLTAYILQLNGYPVGEILDPRDRVGLENIFIEPEG